MKTFLIIIVLHYIPFISGSQDLKKVSLSENERSSGVFNKYEYWPKEGHGALKLILRTNGSYLYERTGCLDHGRSEGKWKKSGGKIFLRSFLQRDSVPVSIDYSGKGDFVDSLNIAVVRNLNGDPLTDAFVLVNNDSTKCLPLIGQCDKPFNKISRLKVLFENGLSSPWIEVKDGERKISLTVLTNAVIANYIVMEGEVFKVVRGGLRKG